MTNKPRASNPLIAGGYALMILAFLLAGVLPYVLAVSSAKAQIASSQNDLDARKQRTSELRTITDQVALLKLETQDVSRLVPPNQDLGAFLSSLYQRLNESGLHDITVRNLAPIALVRSQKLPIEIRGKGTYARFHDFLTRLERLERLSSVGKISVDADSDMAGGVEITLTLYIYSAKQGA